MCLIKPLFMEVSADLYKFFHGLYIYLHYLMIPISKKSLKNDYRSGSLCLWPLNVLLHTAYRVERHQADIQIFVNFL